MNRITQPNNYTCWMAVCAMIVDEPIAVVMDFLGHDGSYYVPDGTMIDGALRAGTHDLEAMAFLLSRGYTLGTQIAPEEFGDGFVFDEAWQGFFAVVFVESERYEDATHIVYWDGECIRDPNPESDDKRDYSSYKVQSVAQVQKYTDGRNVGDRIYIKCPTYEQEIIRLTKFKDLCSEVADLRAQLKEAQTLSAELKDQITQARSIAETGDAGYILPDSGEPIKWLQEIGALADSAQKQVDVFASGEPHPQVFVCQCGTVVGPILDDNAHCDCGDPAYGFEYHRYVPEAAAKQVVEGEGFVVIDQNEPPTAAMLDAYDGATHGCTMLASGYRAMWLSAKEER